MPPNNDLQKWKSNVLTKLQQRVVENWEEVFCKNLGESALISSAN